MRRIIVQEFITLDGVMQGPGGPEEGFEKYGGWSAPLYDDALAKIAVKPRHPAKDLLLGRKTFEANASFWPAHEDMWPGINDVTKYVVSKTLKKSGWKNSVFLDSIEDVIKLRKSEGRDLLTFGSGNLVQTLLKLDLVDELWVLISPLTLGAGNKLFDSGTIPAAFSLVESTATPGGVIVANYKRAGEVKTGSMDA